MPSEPSKLNLDIDEEHIYSGNATLLVPDGRMLAKTAKRVMNPAEEASNLPWKAPEVQIARLCCTKEVYGK